MNAKNLGWKTGLCLVLGTLMAANASAALGTMTVQVDCTAKKPKSINAEIAKASGGILVIEITGLCSEDVRIERRSHIVLRGTDPDRDGIQAVSVDSNEPPNFGRVLSISSASNISIENLTITGGARGGIGVADSGVVFLVNSRLVGNARFGLVTVRSNVVAENTEFTGNGLFGAVIGGSTPSRLICISCTITADRFALLVLAGSRVQITDSTLDANVGLVSTEASNVDLINTSVTGPTSINMSRHSSVNVDGGTLDGNFLVSSKASLELRGVSQTGSLPNVLKGDAYLDTRAAGGVRTTIFELFLTEFSNARLSETDVTGLTGLICAEGSDAFCETNVTKFASSCSLCP